NVRLKRYFSEGSGQKGYLFLVDEAHNLVPRAREMYSAALIKEDVLLVKRILKAYGSAGRLLPLLDGCNRRLLELKKAYGTGREEEGISHRQVLGQDYELLSDIHLLVLELMKLFGELEGFMNDHGEFKDRDLVLDFYFKLRDFLYVHDRLDEHYRIYARLLPEGEFMVKLMCIDPAPNLRECLELGSSTLFFSATLLPIRYYKELLSGNQEEYAVYAHSPFVRENRLVLAAEDVSSRYSRRSRREYEKICDYIEALVKGKKGNYMVFCPSYQYLSRIEEVLSEREEREGLSFTWFSQSSQMAEEEREEFLSRFDEVGERSMAALCVMGGIFSEGIDLREERLIGALIIGTGLPQVNIEQEILKEYFDKQGGGGFDYAYQYPGMNKVMQAAGRVIRTAKDRGIIALLDERFLRPEYVALFPREWGSYTVVNRYNVSQAVEDFWKQFDEPPTACP
ncbi:MAG: ATP-dependent DNA helicase, partial [Clostridiales bacterium]|nr:ATP-dependent DNA helicase [Clostridiales bacterium]